MNPSEIKSKAKEYLQSNWWILFLISAFVLILSSLFSYIPPYTYQNNFNIDGSIINVTRNSLFGNYIWLFLLFGVFQLSQAFIFLKTIKGEKPIFNEIFKGFKYFIKADLITIFITLLSALWLLLAAAPLALTMLSSGNFTNGLNTSSAQSIILVIAFFASLFLLGLAIYKIIRYTQSYYILSENPEMSAWNCIRKSVELMHGNFWRLVRLTLSFIGWLLLSLLIVIILSVAFDHYFGQSFASNEIVSVIYLLPFAFLIVYFSQSLAVFYTTLKPKIMSSADDLRQ